MLHPTNNFASLTLLCTDVQPSTEFMSLKTLHASIVTLNHAKILLALAFPQEFFFLVFVAAKLVT